MCLTGTLSSKPAVMGSISFSMVSVTKAGSVSTQLWIQRLDPARRGRTALRVLAVALSAFDEDVQLQCMTVRASDSHLGECCCRIGCANGMGVDVFFLDDLRIHVEAELCDDELDVIRRANGDVFGEGSKTWLGLVLVCNMSSISPEFHRADECLVLGLQ